MGWTQRSSGASVLYLLALQREKAGEIVTALLSEKDWTHEDLARESGVSVKTVSRIANGKHDARKNTRHAIASALGKKPDEIWDRDVLELDNRAQAQLDNIEDLLEKLWSVIQPQQEIREQLEGAAHTAEKRRAKKPAASRARKKATQR